MGDVEGVEEEGRPHFRVVDKETNGRVTWILIWNGGVEKWREMFLREPRAENRQTPNKTVVEVNGTTALIQVDISFGSS